MESLPSDSGECSCRPVVEGDPSGGLLLAEEGWRLHLGVAEAQILVEIIKAVDKVTNMAAQHLKRMPGGFPLGDRGGAVEQRWCKINIQSQQG
ncbi:hypothetical protein EYF80_024985 [Liparis tanakae]|uniref:Uncharacterized protein n=1 Tax=Liparis tanakae TaxID=230148 RepID=A0A4Z2HGX3_9TELE|nr:hypothetical protein EYF80_024985 [Liparis tanakae]